MTNCGFCGESILSAHPNRRWCSDDCRYWGNGRWTALRIFPRRCDQCREWYTGRRKASRFCSPRCRRRQRKADGDNGRQIARSVRKAVLTRDGGVCQLCGRVTDANDYVLTSEGHTVVGRRYPSLDHIIPRSFGGGNDEWNLRCACHGCNTDRGDNLQVEELGELIAEARSIVAAKGEAL